MDKELKREIIIDNYQNPYNKKTIEDSSYIKINTNNESCIDDLDIYFKVENGVFADAGFNGEACAISTSATSIMLKSLINKKVDEVKELLNNYINMINEQEYDKDLLKELNVYDEIYLQPNRKNCALLPAKAVEKLLKELEHDS
ncbi:MAG: SUF system NifU family Fe-S cluster assembly protein [Bacilli bacterium]|nr:SUF system NifU family Fe-S cluster assembly protein [Bacilli bacterium]